MLHYVDSGCVKSASECRRAFEVTKKMATVAHCLRLSVAEHEVARFSSWSLWLHSNRGRMQTRLFSELQVHTVEEPQVVKFIKYRAH